MPAPSTAVVILRTRAPKLRLAGHMSPSQREELTLDMFRHVVACLLGAGLEVVALTRGDVVDVPPGVDVIADRGPSLNASLDRAVADVGTPLAVMASDLPWMTRGSVDALLSEPGDVVVASTADGGTSGLVMREVVPASFGPRSAVAHSAAGHARGLRVRVVSIPGLDRDLDDAAGHRLATGRAPAFTGD